MDSIHAYSGAEALKIIEGMGSNIAIILLDVVTGSDVVGLTVARIMREQMMILEPRIILRIDQPANAPQEQASYTLKLGCDEA